MRKLRLIAVTGSHGKSITAKLIAGVLRAGQFQASLVDADIPTRSLYKKLVDLWYQGIDYAVLVVPHEVMRRSKLPGIRWDMAVLTNLSGDYRDLNDSFNDYGQRKLKLFKKVKASGVGVVNADDTNALAFLEVAKDSVGYGVDEGDVRLRDIIRTSRGFRLTIDGSEFDLNCHNTLAINYALAAVAVGQKLGLSDIEIAKGLATFSFEQ